MFPPRLSSDSNISSDVLEPVDLNANRSIIWLTPSNSLLSYRDPASTYTPTPEKGPGRASVATRMPFGKVDT